jgi:hypothetical protein
VSFGLKAENEQLRMQLRQAVAHCKLAHDKITKLQAQINAKSSKRKNKNLNVDARCLTAGEGAVLRDTANAVREAEERRRQVTLARKEEEEASTHSSATLARFRRAS